MNFVSSESCWKALQNNYINQICQNSRFAGIMSILTAQKLFDISLYAILENNPHFTPPRTPEWSRLRWSWFLIGLFRWLRCSKWTVAIVPFQRISLTKCTLTAIKFPRNKSTNCPNCAIRSYWCFGWRIQNLGIILIKSARQSLFTFEIIKIQ